MPIVPGTKESYIGALLENIIYGAYLSVFAECCVLFWKKKARGAKQIYLLVTTLVLFVFITGRCIIDTVRCIIAFDNPDLDFGPPNSALGIITNFCWTLGTPVADVFIVFRTFVVWNGNWWLIILPSLLCLANIGAAVFVNVTLIEVGTTNGSIALGVTALDTFISLSLATNVVCTFLIAFRIIQIHRRVAWMVSRRSDSMRVLSIIVESAAVYTLLLVGMLIANRVNGFVSFIFMNCASPTIGLVFSYIIIRVSRGTSYGETTANISTASFARFKPSNRTFELGQSTMNTRPGEVEIRLEGANKKIQGEDEANVAKFPAV
ncbi:hypothetical protein FB451DRAFT_1258618 [Mycena latifolia]|nr:hypothetical protein FB451DRAFT_1258618 [Mycena latifolia]